MQRPGGTSRLCPSRRQRSRRWCPRTCTILDVSEEVVNRRNGRMEHGKVSRWPTHIHPISFRSYHTDHDHREDDVSSCDGTLPSLTSRRSNSTSSIFASATLSQPDADQILLWSVTKAIHFSVHVHVRARAQTETHPPTNTHTRSR